MSGFIFLCLLLSNAWSKDQYQSLSQDDVYSPPYGCLETNNVHATVSIHVGHTRGTTSVAFPAKVMGGLELQTTVQIPFSLSK
jgi:hypothetical protein